MSQAALAAAVGTAVQVVSRIERGEGVPSLSRLAEIADALDVQLRDVFTFDEKPQRAATEQDAIVKRLASMLRRRPVEDARLIADIAERLIRRLSAKRGR